MNADHAYALFRQYCWYRHYQYWSLGYINIKAEWFR